MMAFFFYIYFILQLFLISQAFHLNKINTPFSEAVTSHSEPPNHRINEPPGYEPDIPEVGDSEMMMNNSARKKRSPYYGYGGYNSWRSPSLTASISPDYHKQIWITNEHNRYRRMVPAKNMRMVYWSNELARSAQAHADTCDFHHSRNRPSNVGENIWAAPYYDYSDAIQRWYIEINNPWCACSTGYKHCCGHYIQMVWAETNLIGCGYAHCNGINGVGAYARAVFVCHYNPQGNRVMPLNNGGLYSYPAYIYAARESERCSECPEDQPSCHDGLCYMPLNYKRLTTTTTTEKPKTTTTTELTTKRKTNNWYNKQQITTTTTLKTPIRTTTTTYKYPNYYYNKQRTLEPKIYPSWEAYYKEKALEKQLQGNKVDNRKRKT